MNTKITLKAVAERAGCSINAASTVLNGARGKTGVSDETRERLVMAAAEMGYRPNLMARAMQSNRSRQIGVLVRNNSRVNREERLAHPIAYEFVLGISEELEQAGYMMSFVRLSDVDPRQHLQASAFQGHLLDGLIVVNDVPAAEPKRLQELVPQCVWLDNAQWHPSGCVQRDERGAGATAAREACALGYRRLLVLSQPERGAHFSQNERFGGVMDAARACGADVEKVVMPWHQLEAYRALCERLEREVAVIALNAYIVAELQGALMMSRRVPGEDFALISCDEGLRGMGQDHIARVSFARFEMGRRAARLMIDGLDGSAPPSQRTPVHWIAGPTARPLL